jgi:chromate transporter
VASGQPNEGHVVSEARPASEALVVEVPFRRFLLYFLELGSLGFGGPIATFGYMQRDLVETRRWMSKQDLVDGIALGQTMPGPLAAQVAMWVGYLRRGALGALGTAAAFITPSFVLVLVIGFLYVRFQGLPAVQSLFYGSHRR